MRPIRANLRVKKSNHVVIHRQHAPAGIEEADAIAAANKVFLIIGFIVVNLLKGVSGDWRVQHGGTKPVSDRIELSNPVCQRSIPDRQSIPKRCEQLMTV